MKGSLKKIARLGFWVGGAVVVRITLTRTQMPSKKKPNVSGDDGADGEILSCCYN